MPRRMRRDAGPQPLAQLFRAQRNIRETLEQGTQVKPRANSEYRQPLPRAKIIQHGNGPLAIIPGGCWFARIQHINQMMRYALPLFECGLRRADIKPAIELRGIASHHFASKLLGEPNRKRRFSRSGWPNDGNEWRIGV